MRRVLSLILTAAIVLALCACTDKTAAESSETSVIPDRTVSSTIEETTAQSAEAEVTETIAQTTVETTEETVEQTETEQTTTEAAIASTTTAADPDDGCLGDDFILN